MKERFMPKRFLVTTPIYYPSGDLHLGHAYTTTLADVLKRYKTLQGYETFLLTGSDEHGQKIAKKALAANQEPLVYLDKQVAKFKDLWAKLKIDYDQFIRTTDPQHKKTVQKIFSDLLSKNLIYKGHYEGLYCTVCEEFLTPDQIDSQGLCILSKTKPEHLKEDTYFLKLKEFQHFAEDLLKSEWLIPKYRRAEIIKNFIRPGIKDLSVTRVSTKWGIPIKEDPKHVIYVWLDALTNYISALGYGQKNHQLLDKFWAEDTEIVQLIGKEIVRFHSIYWPVILKALGLRLPDKLIAHGWILNRDTKMSKSLNNVVNPLDIIERYGVDALRFYLAHELPTNRDGNFTIELFEESFNANLANNLGNLVSRVHNMVEKYRHGQLKTPLHFDSEIKTRIENALENYQIAMNQYNISEASHIALNLSAILNKYIEQSEPWKLTQPKDNARLDEVLATLQYGLWVIIHLLSPILVSKTPVMLEQIGWSKPLVAISDLKKTKGLKFETLGPKKIIFNRLKLKNK